LTLGWSLNPPSFSEGKYSIPFSHEHTTLNAVKCSQDFSHCFEGTPQNNVYSSLAFHYYYYHYYYTTIIIIIIDKATTITD
jgi:hypothetical protein